MAYNRSLSRPRAVAIPVQGRTIEQDVDGVTRYSCSKCQITYYLPRGQRAHCPLCEAERRILELQRAMTGMRNQIEQLENNATRLQANLDTLYAMREALETIGAEDLTFLKSVLYRYRADKGCIQLRATHGKADRGKAPPANGFLAAQRGGEPEAHLCSSIGGVAIASYYEEVLRSAGPVQALAMLMRALNQMLTVERSRAVEQD